MFIILIYDVGVKRVAKVTKICKKYLLPVQNSVFEGYITDAKLATLKKELLGKIDTNHDSIQIYRLPSTKFITKDGIGIFRESDCTI